jgi:6,7-dimethyl-8-ribityllumazine synthase
LGSPEITSMSLQRPSERAVDGARFSFGIAAARYNEDLTESLGAAVRARLLAAGVRSEAIEIVQVPGSGEVPFAIQRLATSGRFDCCIGLGVLIRGGTIHYELIANSSAQALQQVALTTGVPVINGIVVAENQAQAEERCRGAADRGAEFALAALEMAALRATLA